MPELFAAWRDLCLLRIGPKDLPHAPTLLATLAVLNVLLGLASGLLAGNPGHALVSALVGIVVMFGLLYGLLAARRLQPRFVQAATALMAAGLLFGVLVLPAYLYLVPFPTDAQTLTRAQLIAVLVLMVISLWSLAVSANIYRQALERSWFAGVVITLAINVIAVVVFGALVGGNAGAPLP